ncbi:hypothetical protein [Lentibacillus sediminis]|uniref:hypothetical protein n=1 Tax=Lentibacillus sediminis TaxID=1940529 RepID=UPI000C1C0377|nr:hypothetical protein [Lentibacillus sediminis]
MKDFFEENGFTIIRKTYMPVMPVANAAKLIPPEEPSGIVKSIADISHDELLKTQLIRMARTNYINAHEANPVAELSWDTWKKLVFADDMIKEGSYIYCNSDGTEILAYSFLHKSTEPETLELGWCGAIDEKNADFIPPLVYRQIRYAKQHGWKYLQGEFDTTDFFAMKVLRSFPFSPAPTWITYRKEID